MKRLLLIGCLFAAFACTKEPAELSGGDSGPTLPRIVGTPTSGLALKGAISIKLTPEKSSVSSSGRRSSTWASISRRMDWAAWWSISPLKYAASVPLPGTKQTFAIVLAPFTFK